MRKREQIARNCRGLSLFKYTAIFFAVFSFYKFAFANLGFTIVTNKSVDIKNMDVDQIRRYFHADIKTWPDGTPLTIVTFPSGTMEEKVFLNRVLKKTSPQMKKHYLKKVFSGELSELPLEAEDSDEVIEIISKIKGTIGYVPKKFEVPPSVNVVSVGEN